jgi:hypothetical protein
MQVTRLFCPGCDITVEGRFSLDRFSLLEEEVVDFIEVFILSRGNIKEIEKKLGVSYPTVKSRIDRMVGDVEKMKELEQRLAREQEEKRKERDDRDEKARNLMSKK